MIVLGNNICRLCLQESKLRNSHILPEFLYADVYDEQHRALIISKEKEKVFQKGIRERLLCQQCETKLSRYEKYAKETIRKIPDFSRDTNGRYLFSENVDYFRFKLFQLSILWRASISTDLAFEQIEIGPHEEKIRCMLNEGNAGNSFDYGCRMSIVLDTKFLHKIIQSPTRLKKKFFGHTSYKFVTGNLTWTFFVSGHRITPTMQELVLQESGLLRVFLSRHDENAELLKIAIDFHGFGKK